MDSPTPKSQRKAFTPRQIYVASFLGTPLSAAWFVRKNFLLADAPKRGFTAVWRGSVLTIVVFVIAYFLPERVPNILLPLIYSLLVYAYAHSVFDKPVKLHLETGGAKGSWWEILGVSIVTITLVVALVFALFYVFATIGIAPVDASDA